MKITFIVGNGFDIQLGLDSRYSDFLKEYIVVSETDSENIVNFKAQLSQEAGQLLWSDAEKAMGVHLGDFSDESIEEYIDRIADFEGKMVDYLERQQNKCFFDDKERIRSIFLNFILRSFDDVLNRRKDDLNTNVKSQNTYQFITFNYTNLLQKIRNCCIINNNNTIQTRQIGGNKYSDILGQIYHVHGSLTTQIIMGVNDESQLNLDGGVTLSEQMKWQLIKPRMNQESRNNWDEPVRKAIAESDIIAIYGVSYGSTDNIWWQEIQKWLRASISHKLVAFIRDAEQGFDNRLPWQEINYELRKRREILQKLGVKANNPDFDQLHGQIYIVLNTVRLNLKDILLKKPTKSPVTA